MHTNLLIAIRLALGGLPSSIPIDMLPLHDSKHPDNLSESLQSLDIVCF